MLSFWPWWLFFGWMRTLVRLIDETNSARRHHLRRPESAGRGHRKEKAEEYFHLPVADGRSLESMENIGNYYRPSHGSLPKRTLKNFS